MMDEVQDVAEPPEIARLQVILLTTMGQLTILLWSLEFGSYNMLTKASVSREIHTFCWRTKRFEHVKALRARAAGEARGSVGFKVEALTSHERNDEKRVQ